MTVGSDHVLRDYLRRICVRMGVTLKTARGWLRDSHPPCLKEGPRGHVRQGQAVAHLASPRFLPVAVQKGPVEAQQ